MGILAVANSFVCCGLLFTAEAVPSAELKDVLGAAKEAEHSEEDAEGVHSATRPYSARDMQATQQECMRRLEHVEQAWAQHVRENKRDFSAWHDQMRAEICEYQSRMILEKVTEEQRHSKASLHALRAEIHELRAKLVELQHQNCSLEARIGDKHAELQKPATGLKEVSSSISLSEDRAQQLGHSHKVPTRTPVHVFAYANEPSQGMAVYASSVESIGTRANIIGFNHSTPLPAELSQVLAKVMVSSNQQVSQVAHAGQRDITPHGDEHVLLRKFFSLSPHLKSFADDEVILFSDAYDVKVEAHSAEQLRAAFEKSQREHRSSNDLPWGPVVFSGEINCWPFPNKWSRHGNSEVYVSGNYRPDYVYALDENTQVRGDEICAFWASKRPHGQIEAGPIHLPFPNSGVFIGRVGSLRHMFAYALETLRLYGDFRDQALVYSMLLRSFVTDSPRILRVDVGGELLATLHGLDIDAVADQLDVARCCDFQSWHAREDHACHLQEQGMPAGRRTLPLVLHFSGAAKFFFQERCYQDMMNQFSLVGARYLTVKFIDYDHQKGIQLDSSCYAKRCSSQMRVLQLPWRGDPLTIRELIGMLYNFNRKRAELSMLRYWVVSKSHGPQHVHEIDLQRGRKSIRWFSIRASPNIGKAIAVWRRPISIARALSRGLNVVIVKKSVTGCGGDLHARRAAYCSLYTELRAAWKHLQPSSTSSAGLLWIDINPHDLRAADRKTNVLRPCLKCGTVAKKMCSVYVSKRVREERSLCSSWAVLDFIESLLPQEALVFSINTTRESVLFVRKLASATRTGHVAQYDTT